MQSLPQLVTVRSCPVPSLTCTLESLSTPQSLGSPSCQKPSAASDRQLGIRGKRRTGLGLKWQVFLVAGVRKGKERERFQGRRRGSEAELSGGPWFSGAGPRGWRGIWRSLQDWSQAVRKGNSGARRVEAEGGCPTQKEGMIWRCRGLISSAGTQTLACTQASLWHGPQGVAG